jgi:diadenylate cyclase
MFDMFTRLADRISSAAYDPVVVLFELLLIGLSVNWCAGVLQGTRGTRLIRGLMIMLVVVTLIVNVLAVQMDWTRLQLLYRYFLIGLALIALVAFQPELRRALMRAGEVSFLRRSAPPSRLIASLVESAGYLSRNRFGALIAIQRDVALGGWAENGTPINAEVSANLLNSIFFPNSPLHDLGVIIQDARITAASCQFPTAESGEVEPALGSRHRAAVGLSFESDALVLVVSEETGTISVADGGKLTRFLSLDDLEQLLQARLAGRALGSMRRGFPIASLSDLWRIARRFLVVATLTLVIWYLAAQASLIDIEGVKVQLAVAHPPTVDVQIIQPQPAIFGAAFSGTTRAIDRVRSAATDGGLKVEWRLPDEYLRAGEFTAPLSEILDAHQAIRRLGVSVKDTTPKRLTFRVDEIVTILAPLKLESGAVRVEDVRIDPPEARIALRRSDLARIPDEQRIALVRVGERLAGAPPDQTRTLGQVPVELRIGDAPVFACEPSQVNVTLRVAAQRGRKRLTGVVVQLVASPQLWQRYQIELVDANEWLIDVELEADRALADALKPQDVRAFVAISGDEAGAADGLRTEEVTLSLPAGVTAIGPPRLVQFRLLPRETEQP